MDHHYDAIVVGGRCAGAATAMLLARGGMRVLVVEAARPGTDTLSTHALMRGGVLQLHRWGLLDAVVDAGTPAIRSTEFAYGDDEVETVDIRPSGGISALYAPRRTVLDPLLLEAARVAGAEVRIPARVTRVLTDGGRVHGVEGIERGTGIRFRATAPLTVGADGRNSTIARAVDARLRRRGTESSALLYGYFPGLPRDRYHWVYRPGVTAGVVPTNDGMACVWAGTASDRFTRQRSAGLDATYRSLLAEAAPELARSIGASTTRRHAARLSGSARLDPRLGRPRLGAGRRRRLFQGPDHRARHHGRPARRRTARPGGPRSTPQPALSAQGSPRLRGHP